MRADDLDAGRHAVLGMARAAPRAPGSATSVLNGVVMHQPSTGWNFETLPLIFSTSGPEKKSAFTAGTARVGQMKTSCFSIIGPKVSYIFAAPSMARRKSVGLGLLGAPWRSRARNRS